MPALCHLQPEYETPRLRMRLLRRGDEYFLAFLDSDPSVMQHIHCGPLSQANARHFARLQIEMAAFRIHLGKWIALLCDHMAPIGWVELSRHKGRDRDDIQLGYEIAVEHWGRGYATEASRPLIGYAFGGFARRPHCSDCTTRKCRLFPRPRQTWVHTSWTKDG